MAKKVRRVRRRSRKDKNLGSQQAADSLGDEKRGRSQTKAAIPDDQELEEEYAYVIHDLRRVFILAAVLFVLLIALNVLLG